MMEAKQRTLDLTFGVTRQTMNVGGRVLTPEMTAEALNTFRGPQGIQGKPGNVSFNDLTEEQVEMLRGPVGPAGKDGKDGKDGVDGKDAPQDAYTPSNPPPYPVTKVNGKCGDVKLTAEDVGAATQESVSQLEQGLEKKADTSGWTPNKIIGTNAAGNLVAQDPPEGSGGDADTLGGVAAADYLLKTDTAADSEKLGGVAAAKYLRPSNYPVHYMTVSYNETNTVSLEGLVSMINVYNTQIPTGITIIQYNGVYNNIAHVFVHKMNDTYGRALAISFYYPVQSLHLDGGTWKLTSAMQV